MAGYGWDEYDVRQGGKQTIRDGDNKIDVTTEFVKFPGGEHGGGWGVRVKGTPRADAPPEGLLTTVMFYGYMDGLGSLAIQNEPNELGVEGTVTMAGETAQLGKFKIDVTTGPGTNRHPMPSHESYKEKPLDRTIVTSFQVPEDQLWQTTRTSVRTWNRGQC
jgi:mannosyl-oligosaccharide glucosidase